MESLDSVFGLKNGTFAPYDFAIVAIFLSSVVTMTDWKSFDLIADLIACAINGFPKNNFVFFPGTPFEPPRAGIIHIGFNVLLFFIYDIP